jgi:hypothetical protein
MKRHALFGELAASLVARVDAMPHAIIRMSIIPDATICPGCNKFCTAAVRAQLEVCIHEFGPTPRRGQTHDDEDVMPALLYYLVALERASASVP